MLMQSLPYYVILLTSILEQFKEHGTQKGITLYSYKHVSVQIAVSLYLFSLVEICQKPLVKSKVVKYFAFPSAINISSRTGRSQLDFLLLFSFLKSVQNFFAPSFLSNTIKRKLQWDPKGWIILAYNMLSIRLFMICLLEMVYGMVLASLVDGFLCQ